MDRGRPDRVVQALDRFASLVEDAGPDVELDELALSISAVLQPDLDTAFWLRALDDLAAQCPAPTREAVVGQLFASGRFSGDAVTYQSWQNSCLDRVIATGRGIPISLSVLTIEVARRLGVRLVGIGMPGHFLVGDPTDPEWFLDAFNGGRVLGRSGCEALYERVTASTNGWQDSYLQPTPTIAIVARMLTNLRNIFQVTDHVRLALVTRMSMALPFPAVRRGDPRRVMALFN